MYSEVMFDYASWYEIFAGSLLGVTQGITEFLPISSTAHLFLGSTVLLKGNDIGLIATNLIQFGTLMAIIQFFSKDLSAFVSRIRQIISSPKAYHEFIETFSSWILSQPQEAIDDNSHWKTDITLAQLVIGTIPIVVLGGLLNNFVSDTRSIPLIAMFILAGSGLMAFAEFVYKESKKMQRVERGYFTISEVILIGMFQTLAIFPGISRSGATLSGSLFIGKGRKEATRFSFLLAIPALFLAGVLDIFRTIMELMQGNISLLPPGNNDNPLSLVALGAAFILSYLSGYISLKWLLNYLSHHTLWPFIIYRVILASGLLLWYGWTYFSSR
jgi:undecaprenyl-diphosphatase